MTPDVLLKELNQYGMGTERIAEKIGCSIAYVVKLRNGQRKTPSYLVMDRLRELHRKHLAEPSHE